MTRCTSRSGGSALIALLLVLVGCQVLMPAGEARTQQAAGTLLTDADIERFLHEARVIRTRSTDKGVTNSIRATLSDGTVTHDVHIQTVDEKKAQAPMAGGTELNFRDSWTFNVAAYRLDRMIGLHLVPVSVARRHRTKPAAFTWWIDDVMMDEGERSRKKTQPPQPGQWNERMQLIRVFDQLIYNVDRNQGNLIITNDWRVWAIDHTRAFRLHKTLKSPASVARCDRQVFARLKALDKDLLKRELTEFLSDWEIDGLLARRDQIVSIIEQAGLSGLFDRRDITLPVETQFPWSARQNDDRRF